jgi:hypothetical protein
VALIDETAEPENPAEEAIAGELADLHGEDGKSALAPGKPDEADQEQ